MDAQNIVWRQHEIAGGDVADAMPAPDGLMREHGRRVAGMFLRHVVDEKGNQHRVLRSDQSGEAALDSHLFDARLSVLAGQEFRSEEHTSELQSLLSISYAVFCLKTKTQQT